MIKKDESGWSSGYEGNFHIKVRGTYKVVLSLIINKREGLIKKVVSSNFGMNHSIYYETMTS